MQHLAVALVGFARFKRHACLAGLPTQDDVDHAGDRIGAVLRRCAVAQHFDPIDGRNGDRVDVGAGRTAADGLLHVHQRLLVPTLAVDQHQHLVGTQRAQRGGADDVGPVADEGTREIEAGLERLQHLADLLYAGLFELLAADHIHGRGGFGGGAAARARTEHLDGVETGGLVCCGFGFGRLRALVLRVHERRDGERQRQEQCRTDGACVSAALRLLGDTHGVAPLMSMGAPGPRRGMRVGDPGFRSPRGGVVARKPMLAGAQHACKRFQRRSEPMRALPLRGVRDSSWPVRGTVVPGCAAPEGSWPGPIGAAAGPVPRAIAWRLWR